ncbi:MAG TPA: hypothetical protein VFI22_14265, partial [Thermomicrobiales bacterium]|nr:hypothetical protein [Thermomicrobiales bacterium]
RMTGDAHQSVRAKEAIVAKTPLTFPVRGVPGGWQDEWSAPDPAATARRQFVAWEAAQAERLEQLRQAGAVRGGAGTEQRGGRNRSTRSGAPMWPPARSSRQADPIAFSPDGVDGRE